MAEDTNEPPVWKFKEWAFAITALLGIGSNIIAVAVYAKGLESNQVVLGVKLDNQTQAINDLKAQAVEREGRIRAVERDVAELRSDIKLVMRVVGARRSESE